MNVNIDELKVGDKVGYCRHIDYSWRNYFRYPIVEERTIKRITPKRTKFVLDNDMELDVRKARDLVIIDNEAKMKSAIAKRFNDIKNMEYEIDNAKRSGRYIIENKLSDNELLEYHGFLKKIYDKYIKEN